MPEPELKPQDQQTPPTPVQVEIPKTKEDWNNLAKSDPAKFIELTQTRMDKTFREAREAQERLAAAEARERNLLAELNQYKTPQPATPPVQDLGTPTYGNGNYPQTEAEWNDLFIERPAFATDLRNEYFTRRKTVQTEFETTRTNSRKLVQQEHKDMYLTELDETGNVRKDASGNPILKLDSVSGEPIFNPDSEKGKLWVEIYGEDPQGWSSIKNAPQLMMAEMERRLRVKGARMIKGQNNEVEQDAGGVAPEGVPPPKAPSLKFDSDEEKAHAERAVSRGTYKSLEEYQKFKNMGDSGYAEPNRRPDFSKR